MARDAGEVRAEEVVVVEERELGQRRSDGVKKMLLLLGAKENQVESVSLGEEKPKAEGSNEQAWSQNRRSDMLYAPEF